MMTDPRWTAGTAHALAALDGDELSTLAARLGRARRPIADLLLEASDEGRVNTGWLTDYEPGHATDTDPGTAALLAVATLATNDGDAAWSLYHRIIGVTTDPGLADTLDTIADGQDDDLGQVLAAAASRLRRQPIDHEAICGRCAAGMHYVGEYGAPGHGQAWECANGHPWARIGGTFIDPSTGDHILTIDDVR